jgi:hypothetical protein
VIGFGVELLFAVALSQTAGGFVQLVHWSHSPDELICRPKTLKKNCITFMLFYPSLT